MTRFLITPKRLILAISLISVVYFVINIHELFTSTQDTLKPVILWANHSPTVFYPCIAVIVENRTIDLLVTVVHNINYNIPSSWPIQIFHNKKNEQFIQSSSLAPLISSGKIFLTLLDVSYDKNETNQLLTNPKFWQQVRGEKILFFQIDSIMCSNSPHKITDFLQYDYVGAPSPPMNFPFSETIFVGNGGFSLRSRSKLLALIAHLSYDLAIAEDVWYGVNLHRVNGTVATFETAMRFAVEYVYYERPLAIHKSTSCAIFEKLFKTCPEAQIIMAEQCWKSNETYINSTCLTGQNTTVASTYNSTYS